METVAMCLIITNSRVNRNPGEPNHLLGNDRRSDIQKTYAAAVDNHARDFIKESITVHNYRKKDHECRGYILINDLQLLLCNNTWNQSKDEELTIAAMVGA
uniref:Uncharacterized protein n=1 Tax=Romanomermis culicivorax TaxID=13658 RepID=A0A915I156_ROMCU